MASPIAVSPPPNLVALEVRQFADVGKATGAARRFAHACGFSAAECERLALVAAELASNSFAMPGVVRFKLSFLADADRTGMQNHAKRSRQKLGR